MLKRYRMLVLALSWFALGTPILAVAAPDTAGSHRLFRVTLDDASDQSVSGRLLLFAKPADKARSDAHGDTVKRVDTSPFFPTQTAVTATELTDLKPHESVVVDSDTQAFPKPFSELAAGDYMVQAVLDVNHDYNYSGRGAGDLVSEVTEVTFGDEGDVPDLKLQRKLTGTAPWAVPARMPEKRKDKMRKSLQQAQAHSHAIDFVSPALSDFNGRDVKMSGWVLLPPDYDNNADADYPTVYFTHGFGADRTTLTWRAASIYQQMDDGDIPPMIWVFLDQSGPTGTHEFVNSVNNGPWGKALTDGLIPHLEDHYRMDGAADGRFLTGHSSGGWATLWLQTRYPATFGGTWSTAPDSVDFHDFNGIDLYADDANVYVDAEGDPRPLVRSNGEVKATFQQFARLEQVLGPQGGQMASFEWVFSPRGADGKPIPMFDRKTGAVDPDVVAYWGEHYDIARRIKTHWPQLKDDLDGKIHVIVGTADTFYLDGAVHKLDSVLDAVGADAQIVFRPGRTHMNLFAKDDNRHWLMQQITWAMYHHARPGADIPDADRALIDHAVN